MTANTFYHFDGDPADEAAWRAFVAEHREPSAGEQKLITAPSTAVKKLAELFLLFVVVVALVGTVLRQQGIRRIEELEAEVQRLEAALATAAGVPEVTEPANSAVSEAKKPPVLHVVETEFFRFYVEAGHMAAVMPVVSAIDEEYRQLCMDLELTSTLAQDKYVVYVADTPGLDKVNLPTVSGVIGIDMSLATAQTSGGFVDPALLIHDDLFGQVTRRVLTQVVNSHMIKPQWNALVGHLYPHVAQRQSLRPVDTLPLRELQNRQYAQELPPRLVRLTYEPGDWMFPNHKLANTVADPLIEYILTTYGRTSVPALLDALCEYAEWDEVVAAVFALPTDQFTAAWHAYLQQQYPIDPAQPN